MRMNYKMYPTDYVQELNGTRGVAGRKKSRAFMEYYNDLQHGDGNSYRFYATSWEVSVSTAHGWIDEFFKEIELFNSHWELKNKQHYSYAKNQAEHQPNTNRTQKQPISPNNTDFLKTKKTPTEHQPNKALNYINNNNSNFLFDKDYIDFYQIYAWNTNYPGKKQDAYNAFVNTDVNVDLLKLACMKYLHDEVVDKPVGVKKFLENDLYLPYLPKYMKVKSGDEWYQGIYNDKTFEFKAADGSSLGTIEPKLLVELFEKKELIYLKELEERAS